MAKKELEEVELNIEKATKEVNCLKVAAESLKSELEREKSTLETVKQREGMASVAVASLEADLERMKVEINRVQVIYRHRADWVSVFHWILNNNITNYSIDSI